MIFLIISIVPLILIILIILIIPYEKSTSVDSKSPCFISLACTEFDVQFDFVMDFWTSGSN